jgi:hypothetical protein
MSEPNFSEFLIENINARGNPPAKAKTIAETKNIPALAL